MTGSTVIIEVHGYRGFQIEGGPLGRVLIIGFVSVSYMPFLLTDWLNERIAKLKSVAGSRGFVEMAAWDESRVERTNVSVFQKFPNGIHKRPQ